MSTRARKTTQPPVRALPALPALLIELEASLPCLLAQPVKFSSALTRVTRCLDGTGAPRRPRAPRAAQPSRRKAASPELPVSLPLFP